MSVPVFDHWFSASIRRNRKSFILAMLSLIMTAVLCICVWIWFAETTRGEVTGIFLFGIPALLSSYMLTAQRLRDFGISGWFSLLWLPINAIDGEAGVALSSAAWIVVCCIPGAPGPNKYGPDPLT